MPASQTDPQRQRAGNTNSATPQRQRKLLRGDYIVALLVIVPGLLSATLQLGFTYINVAGIVDTVVAIVLGALACCWTLKSRPAALRHFSTRQAAPRFRGVVTVWLLATISVVVQLLQHRLHPTLYASDWAMTSNWMMVLLAGVLLGVGDKRNAPLWALATGILAVLMPLTMAPKNPDAPLIVFMVAVATLISVGVGAQVRSAKLQLEQTQQQVRTAERQAMARELHDVVAHEVAGIVVVAQAAGLAAGQGPMADVFRRIETSGSRSLASIRAMVSALRESDDPALGVQPTDCADLRQLIDGFAATTDCQVEEDLGVSFCNGLAGAELLACHRVLAESLTNIRRHAANTASVRVTGRLRYVTDDSSAASDIQGVQRNDGAQDATTEVNVVRVLEVINGPNSGNNDANVGAGSGTGLVGMRERAEVLGGTVTAGATPDGGWRVKLELPA